MCPMHETRKNGTTCALRSATHQDGLALVLHLAAVGFVRSYVSSLPAQNSSPVEPYGRIPMERPLAPDAPPPRA
jgi:hypothetical protein